MGHIGTTALSSNTLPKVNLNLSLGHSNMNQLSKNISSNMHTGLGSCPIISECNDIVDGITKGDYKKVALNASLIGLSS